MNVTFTIERKNALLDCFLNAPAQRDSVVRLFLNRSKYPITSVWPGYVDFTITDVEEGRIRACKQACTSNGFIYEGYCPLSKLPPGVNLIESCDIIHVGCPPVAIPGVTGTPLSVMVGLKAEPQSDGTEILIPIFQNIRVLSIEGPPYDGEPVRTGSGIPVSFN